MDTVTFSGPQTMQIAIWTILDRGFWEIVFFLSKMKWKDTSYEVPSFFFLFALLAIVWNKGMSTQTKSQHTADPVACPPGASAVLWDHPSERISDAWVSLNHSGQEICENLPEQRFAESIPDTHLSNC